MEEEVKQEERQEEIKQEGEEKPLDKMTAPELREIAMKIPGVEGAHAMKKEDLLKIVKEARGILEEKPVVKKTKKGSSGEVLSIKDLKGKIARFKAEKAAARQEKDRKKLNIWRRRINHLKKQTRKVVRV